MLKFILRRLLLEALPTLLVLVTVTFFLIRLAPGGPFSSEANMPPEVMAAIAAKYRLDQPAWQQYLGYLADLARGDFGPSFKYKDFTVNDLVWAAAPVSFRLGLMAFVVAVVVGIAAGVTAALRQNSWVDYSVMGIAMIGVVLPNFVLAPVLALVFAIGLKWLPAGGWEGGKLIYVVLPVAVLCQHYISVIARITRGSMIEVLGSPFIRTARAKGLPAGYILRRHALRPALLPVISYLGPAFVGIITGSVVVETFFGIPGIGQLFVNGALNRDYPMVLGLTILIGTLTIFFNAVVDILYGFIDPRIRIH
ncbi:MULTISPECIES: oligopeptide ABC transporter permease OppB [Niveibacterium]|uniref:Oligopeptide ABC transporter permease OppB n=1 Tax=Niveibacterium microcysteis TaxID=2811415 RepID=A0ABX7M795_9RHOO|nr:MULTISPECIES: oligopeptide ABC transporter permease OppB [Niveibacterium]QSI77625.1 oligopeptide ABC transporter permease OppB [Niveibacterium microcysteis]